MGRFGCTLVTSNARLQSSSQPLLERKGERLRQWNVVMMSYPVCLLVPSSSLASTGHPPIMERVLHVLPAQARTQNLFVYLFKLGLFFLPFIQGQNFLLETSFLCVQEKIVKIVIYSILQAIKQLILIKALQTRN